MTNMQSNLAEQDPISPLTVNKNKKSLLLLVVVFALPIILAKFALEQGWLDSGVTNQGILLTEPLTLKDLDIEQTLFSKQWLIVYSLPEQCDYSCQKTLETVHNSYVALGKDMPRITPLLLKRKELSSEQNQRLLASQWQVTQLSEQAKAKLKNTQIFIADPLGNIILSYQPISESFTTDNSAYLEHSQSLNRKNRPSVQQTMLSKAIIADMKKLLKYSKVG
jgi:hypothetical protein